MTPVRLFTPRGIVGPRLRFQTPGQSTLYITVFLVVAGMVLLPLLFLVVSSFQVAPPGEPPVFGLDAWRNAIREPGIWRSIFNSIRLYLATSIISWPTAIILAWIIGRTDLPKRNWIEFLLWLSFFIPSLSVVMGWNLLIAPRQGLLNQVLKSLPFFDEGPFNIFSFWGIVWVHLGQNAIAYKTVLLIPGFRNLDAAMEEASRLSGGGLWSTLRYVVVPLMAPAILLTALLGFVRLWQSFETELVLGVPFGFFVFGTKVWDFLRGGLVPHYGEATVLATSVLLVMFPFLILQRRVTVRKSYEVITGHFRAQPTPLGRWKWPVFAIVLGIALFVSMLPIISVTVGSFMAVFGYFNIEDAWTLEHWHVILDDPVFWAAVRNTFLIGTGAALLAVVLLSLVAYILVRTTFFARAFLDVVTWVPQALPGILLGLGMLWLFLTPVLQPLYGSIYILIFATVISSVTVGVQIIKSNLIQLGAEMEEASRLSGASWFYTMRRVVLPLVAPVLALIATLNFISASRDVSTLILLATGETKTLALLQLEVMLGATEGGREMATVISVLMIIMSAGVAVIARSFGLRLGLR